MPSKTRDSYSRGEKKWKNILYFSVFLSLFAAFCLYLFIFQPSWLNAHPRLIIVDRNNASSSATSTSLVNLACPDCTPRLLDGVLVKKGEENLAPIAVVIDNHPEARPPLGLSQASLVFEAPAEGGTTRYLAVFVNGEKIESIGPVRSARPYFVAWAKELGAVFAHCGGSPEALDQIGKDGVLDMNEFFNSGFFWRDSRLAAPHNVLSSSDLFRRFAGEKGLEEGKYQPWLFSNASSSLSLNLATSSKINIDFWGDGYEVAWNYNSNTKVYERSLAGSQHKDSAGNLLSAKTVIIHYVAAKVTDAKLRLDISLIGSGEAKICSDGYCQEGKWRKDSRSSRTRYYLDNGEEFIFQPGNIWVEVVESGMKIEIE